MSDMILRHFSRTVIKAVHSEAQNSDSDIGAYTKPEGFWVSVQGEDDWPSWCRAENFGDIDSKIEHAVTLAADANILVMSSHYELTSFQAMFGRITQTFGRFTRLCIHWPSVAEQYQGIIIAPYVWSARLELDWYYGWDCASGCIWDASAIDRVVPLSSVLREAAE